MTSRSTLPEVRLNRPRKLGNYTDDNLLACAWVVMPGCSFVSMWIAPVERFPLHAHLIERICKDYPSAETRPLFFGRVLSERFQITESWIDLGTILSIIQHGFSRVIDEPAYADILKARIRIVGHCAMPGTVKSVAQNPLRSDLVIIFQDDEPELSPTPQAL